MADENTTTAAPAKSATADVPKPRPAQTVKIADVGPARKKLTIEIPAERIAEKLSGNLNDLHNEATLPGFRRGRAPMRLIEKRFGSDVRREAKAQLLGECYSQAVEEHNLRVLGEPDIKDADKIELPADGPLSFEVEIEVAPEFELPDLKGLEITRRAVDVTDEQVGAEIHRYGEMHGQMQSVDGSAAAGDYLTADVIVRTPDGEVAEEHNSANIPVSGESRDFKGHVAGIVVADLGKKLAGAKVGDTVTVQTIGPARHSNEKLRDAKLSIDIRIGKIERLEPVPVKQLVANFGFDSEDDLRKQIGADLHRRAEAEQRQDMRNQVAEALLKQVNLDLPQGLSQRQAERTLQRRAIDLMYRGVSPQDIEQHLAEMRASSEDQARRELKLYFILDKAAEKFEITVGEGEINGRIAQMAIQSGRRPEKLRQEMGRSGQLEQLYVQMREQKAIDKLLGDAKIIDAPAEKKTPAPKPAAKPESKPKAEKPKAKAADKAEEKAEDKPAAKKAPRKSTRKKSE